MDSNRNIIKISRGLSREGCLEVFSTLIAPKLQTDRFEAIINSTKFGKEYFIEVYGHGDHFVDAITDIFMESDEMKLNYKLYNIETEYKVFVFKKF